MVFKIFVYSIKRIFIQTGNPLTSCCNIYVLYQFLRNNFRHALILGYFKKKYTTRKNFCKLRKLECKRKHHYWPVVKWLSGVTSPTGVL